MTLRLRDVLHPKRIQRKRTKGWRMPEGAVYVGRPTNWGNPFYLREAANGWEVISRDRIDAFRTRRDAAAYAVRLFEEHITVGEVEAAKNELRGKSLSCWCPLDQPCHADVLLEISNS